MGLQEEGRAAEAPPHRQLSEAEVYLCALSIALWKSKNDTSSMDLPPYLLIDHLLRTGGFKGSNPKIVREIADLLEDATRDLKRLGVAPDMIVDRRRVYFGIDFGYINGSKMIEWEAWIDDTGRPVITKSREVPPGATPADTVRGISADLLIVDPMDFGYPCTTLIEDDILTLPAGVYVSHTNKDPQRP